MFPSSVSFKLVQTGKKQNSYTFCLGVTDFLCDLQGKHCDAIVHSQSHQLLIIMCTSPNEKYGQDKIIEN